MQEAAKEEPAQAEEVEGVQNASSVFEDFSRNLTWKMDNEEDRTKSKNNRISSTCRRGYGQAAGPVAPVFCPAY